MNIQKLLTSLMQGEPTRLKQHLPPLHVKTVEPDYRFTNIDQWKRHITLEHFYADKKVKLIEAYEILQPRLKIMA